VPLSYVILLVILTRTFTFRRPASWIDCTAMIQAVELPPNTAINSNGAGDSFTSGLLVAAMLRHTGVTVPIQSPEAKVDSPLALLTIKKTLTPYTLYMRENYMFLKKQCKDDKKAIFSKCHEMWENESEQVKAMYERKAQEENERDGENEMSVRVMDDIDTLDSKRQHATSMDRDDATPSKANKYMTNRSLNLESAVQFASLVAAYHIDMSTRDLPHIDVSPLLERAFIFPTGLEEI
jgi:hypothetical protein